MITNYTMLTRRQDQMHAAFHSSIAEHLEVDINAEAYLVPGDLYWADGLISIAHG